MINISEESLFNLLKQAYELGKKEGEQRRPWSISSPTYPTYEPAPYWLNPDFKMPKVTCSSNQAVVTRITG